MKPPTPGMHLSRREWLKASAAAGALLPTLPLLAAGRGEVRSYHLCLNPAAVEQDPERLRMIRDAGVDTVWLAGFFYGHQPYSEEQLRRARQRSERAGLEGHLVNVPLGHPGDSLGAKDGDFPLTPPPHWRDRAARPTAGSSPGRPCTIRPPPRTRTPCAATVRWASADASWTMISGSPEPGEIGGCFCENIARTFLRRVDSPRVVGMSCCDDVGERRLTPLLRSWLDFTGDELSDVLPAATRRLRRRTRDHGDVSRRGEGRHPAEGLQERAVPGGRTDVRRQSFTPVKGKTDELFSVLFHRRFARPGTRLQRNHRAIRPTDSLRRTWRPSSSFPRWRMCGKRCS